MDPDLIVDGYTVDVDALSELQSRMTQFVTHASDSLSRVESLIGLVCADWDGAAAQAYQQRHQRWADALRELNANVNDFKEWTARAEQAYRTAMETNLRMASS